jgi:Flp pilus assembly protein TadB
MAEPMNTMLGRFGYIRRDDQDAKTLAIADDTQPPTAYPQVVVIQGHAAGESWIRDHAGQLLVGAGVAVLGLAALAVVALVVVAVAVAVVSCVAALAVASAATATASLSNPRGRGRR